LALELAELGHQIALFDQDSPSGEQSCALTAAGMLSPYSELEVSDSLLLNIGLLSIQRWPEILKKLIEPVYFRANGGILLAHPNDASEIQRFEQLLRHKLKTDPLAEHVQPLNDKTLNKIEPQLQHFANSLYFPKEAHLNTADFMMASTKTLQQHNIAWHSHLKVKYVAQHMIITETATNRYDMVFDCRGLGAKSNQTDLRGVRGEVIWVHAPEVTLNHAIRLLHPRYPVYIVPRPNHHFVIGASSIESEDFSPISVKTLMELLNAAYSVHKGFAEARVINTLVNCRPAYPDNQPRIEVYHGLISINGLFRHGYMLAPILVDEALALMHNHAYQSVYGTLIINRNN